MYKIDQLTEIDLGVVQENEATEIQIDVSHWLKKWPDGIFAVNVCRPGEMEPYPANCRVEDGILYWLVTEGELAIAGNGRCDIRLYQGTVKKKTRIAITRIHETLPGSTQEAPPEAAQGWLDSLNETKAEVEINTKAAKESAAKAALSEEQALVLAQSAAESANAAETAKQHAEAAHAGADAAMAGAEAAMAGAEAAKEKAEAAQTKAETAWHNAQNWAEEAHAHQTAAETAANESLQAAAEAKQNETNAHADAQTAQASASSATAAKEAAVDAQTKAETAWNNLQALDTEAETLEPGENATAEYEKTMNKLLFGIPKGTKGDRGFSPTVSVSKNGKTTTVTVTDLEGTKTFEILDGQDGEGAGDMLASLYDPDGDYAVEKADYADVAGHAASAGSATNAGHATSADSATNAGHATSADSATNAGHATTADSAANAGHATSATNADYAGEAGKARELQNHMTVQLNGGTTENTDKFTFDGTAGKTVNITPEKIGAAGADLSNVDAKVLREAVENAGVSSLFIAEYDYTSIAELDEAYEAGMEIVCVHQGYYFHLTEIEMGLYYAFSCNYYGAQQLISVSDQWGWMHVEYNGYTPTKHASTHKKGGTDALTPADIGAATRFHATATIGTTWAGSGPYTQTVSVSGLLASDTPIVDLVASTDPTTAEAEIAAWAVIYRIDTANGSLTVYASEATTQAITIQILGVR